jgi:hypothetical protein
MRVLYHYENQTKVYTLTPTSLTSTTRYESLIECAEEFWASATRKDILLIAEKNFAYFSFVCNINTQNPCKREDEKRLVREKIAYIKKHYNIDSWCIHYEIMHCTVNGSPTNHILWYIWEISFTIHCALLLPDMSYALKWVHQRFWNWVVHIYPRSFFSRLYLMRHIQRESYYLLDIAETWTQLLQIELGRYKQIEHLNRWMADLKKLYTENWLQEHFYTPSQDGGFVTKTIFQVNNTFVHYIMHWMRQYVPNKTDMLMMGMVTKHTPCIDILAQQYTERFQWYLLPFHNAEGIKQLPDYKRRADELHAACCCMCPPLS